MSIRKPVIITLVLVAVLMLAACGGAPAGSPSNPTATPETAPVETVALPQTITNEESGLTVNYPEGWTGEADGKVISILYTAGEGTEGAPQERIIALVQPVTPEEVAELEIAADAPIADVVRTVAEKTSGEGTSFGDVSAFDINGKPAAQTSGTMTRGEQTLGIQLLMIDLGDVNAMMMVSGTDALMADIEPTLRSMAASLQYNPS